ncbi:metal/formaldehyde-sensitive transcriptional repressor [Oceanobacter kriegii]|uniref:metal/formaldehyde-sensitive transcriptional repressor n=1 Tax=Oceanobacter kriegii TaxID=64972 RepID=UPI0004086879|nr:metal/formaldehyde-sensitive transcriptional repressor [Oceanobacter kriegii]
MAHISHDRDKLLTRVRKIRGQADGLEKLLNNETECTRVLQQIAALRGAVNGLMSEVLEGHLREHLGDNDLTPEKRAEEVDDVVKILRSYMK